MKFCGQTAVRTCKGWFGETHKVLVENVLPKQQTLDYQSLASPHPRVAKRATTRNPLQGIWKDECEVREHSWMRRCAENADLPSDGQKGLPRNTERIHLSLTMSHGDQ